MNQQSSMKIAVCFDWVQLLSGGCLQDAYSYTC